MSGKLIILFKLIIKTMKKILFENSLGNETIEVLGFKTTDALEKELELLTKEIDPEQAFAGYKK
tara:strand:- start:1024 stop:1215 length:192 start_codon:yes stop_codon:yes gene_type:complete